jgi:3-carboxy-cis,cis-muconate cycloisomerase
MSTIFDAFLSTADIALVLDERQVVAAMLRFEAALAQAQAAQGLIPQGAAQAITDQCNLEFIDVPALVRDSARAGSIAIPLVLQLKARVAEFSPEALPYTHFGSTSQDLIDSAIALVTQQALDLIHADLAICIESLADLAGAHLDTPVMARTLMQPASVTSFGYKCVGWLAPLVRARQRLRQRAAQALQLQLGGAVGTLAQMGDQGQAVVAQVADILGLTEPQSAWHTQRDEWVALGCELGLLAGSLGKLAQDLALMGQFEVGEVNEPAEPGRGGSSAMPHKRNPVASMVALAASQRAPQRVASLLACMPQAHERALGTWQAELAEWPQLLATVHGSVRALALALPGLQVDASRMLSNINTLRAQLPAAAAQEWFSPELAQHASQLARRQLALLMAS